MRMVTRWTLTVWFVLSLSACYHARAGEAFLHDRGALQRKITEIVAPFLHHTGQEDDPTRQPKNEPPDNKAASDSPRSRAWAIVVGVVTKDDRHVFGFGRFSAKSDQKPDGRTIFEIGSVTKTFTALLLADLAQRDKLKLDDPVRRYLPESVAVPKRGEKEITLLHLATHTSGLPRIPLSIGLKALVDPNPYRSYSADALYKTLGRTNLSRDPGERYEYSNLAYGLLGHALSRHAGKEYEELVVEQICKPLGLNDTCIRLDEEKRKRLAPPFNAVGEPSANWEFDAIAGAGALRSTADDMLKYLAANMGLTNCQLLPAMKSCHEARRPATSAVQSIGLGWHTEKVPGRPTFVFHGGGTGGYSSIVGFLEDDGTPTIGIVVLANSAPAPNGMLANAEKLLPALHNRPD